MSKRNRFFLQNKAVISPQVFAFGAQRHRPECLKTTPEEHLSSLQLHRYWSHSTTHQAIAKIIDSLSPTG
jgi:hypothetical protein